MIQYKKERRMKMKKNSWMAVLAFYCIAVMNINSDAQQQPVDTTGLHVAPGVFYRYFAYPQCFSNLLDVNLTTHAASDSGIIDTFSLSPATDYHGWSFQFRALVRINTQGEYTFFTKSIDGSVLYLNGSLLVDNHTAQYPGVEKSGTVTLAPGFYSIVVDYSMLFGGSNLLQVSYQGPGAAKTKIPASVLYHAAINTPAPTRMTVGAKLRLTGASMQMPKSEMVDMSGRVLDKQAGFALISKKSSIIRNRAIGIYQSH
jgi:hypothetical protein